MNSRNIWSLIRRAACPLAFAVSAQAAIYIAGCGASAHRGAPAPVSGNTVVTVLGTSTANGKLTQFDLNFSSFTLTSESGKTVSLLPGLEHIEFIHLNGTFEPLFTVSVPSDTYISANATIGPADFVCLGTGPGGATRSATFAYGYVPDSDVTINVPAPVHVEGANTVFVLNLLASQSASWDTPACWSPTNWSITPTFALDNIGSTQVSQRLQGMIGSIDAGAGTITVAAADAPSIGVEKNGQTATWQAPSWTIVSSGATVYQGISGFSALASGMPVEMDVSLQNDGSLIATRIAVADPDTSTMTVFSGPLMTIKSSEPVLEAAGTEQQGYFPAAMQAGYLGATPFNYATTKFEVSGELSNATAFPFSPQFDANSMAAGQLISITWHTAGEQPDPIDIPATTITLLPQTLNGTVTSIGNEGGFERYEISLASYDLFPQFAVQQLQTTVLANPSTVVVYADQSTQLINKEPLTVGTVLRFTGIVFNDGGTLKMNCLRINDGVTP